MRVVVVSYAVPPYGNGMHLRTFKLMKFLPTLGWDITVLTPRRGRSAPKDPSVLPELPAGTRVLRTPALVPPGNTLSRELRALSGPPARPLERLAARARH